MTSADATIARPPSGPLWRNLSFTLMWTSTAASGFGDRMIMLAALALLGALGDEADATGMQAATQFWFFVPYILISIPGGWLADHLPRKWLMLFCDEARGLTLLLCFALLAAAGGVAALPDEQQWKVFGALLAVGAFAAIFNPTRNAIVPQIIPRTQLPAANAVILGINVVASMIGMVIGGRIIDPDSATSVRTGLMTGALFYMVSGTFFAFLRPVKAMHVESAEQKRQRSVMQGMRYIAGHRRVIILVVLNAMVWSVAAAVTTGLLGVLKAHYEIAQSDLLIHFTQVSAVIGVGMLVGALFVTVLGIRRESVTLLMLALIGAGLAVVTLVATPAMPVTYFAAFGLGFTGNVAIVIVITLLQTISPNYVRGRVMGINSMINTICTVSVYLMIWRMPNADTGIIVVLWILGPSLMLVGRCPVGCSTCCGTWTAHCC
jgi:MFS family permease